MPLLEQFLDLKGLEFGGWERVGDWEQKLAGFEV